MSSKRFSEEIGSGVRGCIEPIQQVILECERRVIDQMLPRLQQVIRQTHACIFEGDRHSSGKIVSLFEPSTEIVAREEG